MARTNRQAYNAPVVRTVSFRMELGLQNSPSDTEEEISWTDDQTTPQGRSFSRETFTAGDNWDE